jgi:hypothetical protein
MKSKPRPKTKAAKRQRLIEKLYLRTGWTPEEVKALVKKRAPLDPDSLI